MYTGVHHLFAVLAPSCDSEASMALRTWEERVRIASTGAILTLFYRAFPFLMGAYRNGVRRDSSTSLVRHRSQHDKALFFNCELDRRQNRCYDEPCSYGYPSR